MTTKLHDMIATIEKLPEDAQDRVAEMVSFEAAQLADDYEFTPADLEAIEEGKRQARAGQFVSPEAVTALFDKYR